MTPIIKLQIWVFLIKAKISLIKILNNGDPNIESC